MPKKRNIGLDIIKGFAALLVCMLHLIHVDFGTVVSGETYIPNLTKILYGVCACSVPIFLFVNGYLVGCRQNETKSILMKILNLLKLRVVVGGLIGFIVCIVLSEPHSIGNYRYLTTYLWFFEALIIIYVWTIFWDKIKAYKWSIIFPIFFFIVPFLTNFVGLISALFGHQLSDMFGHWGFFRLYGILYFILPFYMDRKVLPRLWAIVAVVAGLAEIALEVFVWSNISGSVYDGMNACFPTVGALLMTIGFFSLFTTAEYNEENIVVKYFAWLGRNCMGIYLFHMPVIYVINMYIGKTLIPVVAAIAICFAIISTCALIYSWLMKVKYLNYLLKI